MKDFDDKVDAAATKYDQYEHCDLEIAFKDGANFARELMHSEVDRLKEAVKWNLQNNDEYGCEFLGITIVRDENIKLKADLALAVSVLEIYAEKPSDVAWIALAKIRARD